MPWTRQLSSVDLLRAEGGGTIVAPELGVMLLSICELWRGMLLWAGWSDTHFVRTPSHPLPGGVMWTKRLPPWCWRDLGFSIFLRLRINQRINFLFVRELHMTSPPTKIRCLLRTEDTLVTRVGNPSKGGGTLEVVFVQTGKASF